VRSISTLFNRTPVEYVGVGQSRLPWGGLGGERKRQLSITKGTGTAYSIVNRTSTAAATPQWHLHRLAQRRRSQTACPICEAPGVTLVEDHQALRVWNRPNDFFTRQEFVESGQQHVDLAGEAWVVIEYLEGFGARIPRALWLARPDRMEPIPSKENYLVGYIYCGPNGEKVPLQLDEVIQIRTPDPEDPYRGLSPVQSVLRDIDSSRFSAEWTRNFFMNSAVPGGIIKVPRMLDDREFKQTVMRWDEQFKGVNRAHRVGILEGEKVEFVPLQYTMRDMQLRELRELSRDVIMEAYGMAKFDLGIVDDVNRATAEASKASFAERHTVPRLNRWKSALNNDFLPLFGPTGDGYEFVYDNPVPPDREAENAERASKTEAWATLVREGADPDDAADVVGLPRMRMREKEPVEPEPVGVPSE
jgi:HK97 family phage portal protein